MRTIFFPPAMPTKNLPEHVLRAMRAFHRVHKMLEAKEKAERAATGEGPRSGHRPPRYLICLRNEGSEESLEPRKVYRALPDAKAARHGLVRVIDETGDDCLYPADLFIPIKLPRKAAVAFAGSKP